MNEKLQLLLLIGAAVALVGGWFKWLRPKVKNFSHDTRLVKDSLLGRGPIHDSITGEELSPAIPGVGQRMAVIEEAVAAIAANQGQMNHMASEMDDLKGRVTALEAKDLERALARTESIEMLRTIDTAIRSDPDNRGGKGNQS